MPKQRIILISAALAFLLSGFLAHAHAATYYVDNCVVTGNDANNGTSSSTPWLTIAKVNSSTFSAGDSVLFRRTCTWREQLVVPSSGTTGNPITFGAYGTGARPVINGNYLGSGWVNVGGTNSDTSVIASLDDYYVSPSSTFYQGTSVQVIAGDISGASRHGGVRMILNIPQGQTIAAATLKMTGFDGNSKHASVLIHANLSTDSSQVTTYPQWVTAHGSLTSASTTWSVPTYTAEQVLSEDVTAIVQEIVNQGGWVSGKHIQFFLDDNGNASNIYYEFDSYDDTGHATAELVVSVGYPYAWYVTGVPVTPTTVWFNGTLGTLESSIAALTGSNEWFWDTSTQRLYVYATSTPSNITWEVGTSAVRFNAKNYVTLDHLDIRGSSVSGILVDSTTQNATVQYSTVSVSPTGIINNSSGGANAFLYNVVTASTTGVSITSSGSEDCKGPVSLDSISAIFSRRFLLFSSC
jgi:hypothetical protein